MPRCSCDPRSRMTASAAEAPLLDQRIPVAAFSRSADVLGIALPTPKLNGFMRHLQRKRTPLATSGRFRRQNRPETPPSVGVSPGRQSRQRTNPAENRTEPAGRDHGRSLGSRKRRCGRTSDIAGSCLQARSQQPPAPTANGAPAATWTRPCSKSSHIGG